MIKMVISPEYFGNNDTKRSIEIQLKRLGAYGVNIDEETGFVSALITEDKYDKFVNSLKQRVEDTVTDIPNKYKGIKKVEYNSDYTIFDVYVTKTTKKERKYVVFDLLVASATCQVISGIPQSEASIKVRFYNSDNQLIDSINTAERKDD